MRWPLLLSLGAVCLALALVLGRSVLIRAPVGPALEETSGSTLDVAAPEDAHVLRRSDALASDNPQHRESVEARESAFPRARQVGGLGVEDAAALRRFFASEWYESQMKRARDELRVGLLLGSMAAMAMLNRTQVPLDSDDRVHFYFPVLGGYDDKPVSQHCSARSGTGPSKEEILDGDYLNFPYTRFKGRVMHGDQTVPLLWDRDPQPDGRRLVGFNGGTTKWMKEEDLQNLLRGLGQR